MMNRDSMLDLIAIPFHDWRKYTRFGARTRDLHIIEHFNKNEKIQKILIINRPITWAEVILKRTPWKTPGSVIQKNNHARITEVAPKIFVLDYLFPQSINHILQQRLWYFNAYGDDEFVNFLSNACRILEMQEMAVVSQSLYAVNLCKALRKKQMCRTLIFDAWDNFLKFPPLAKHQTLFHETYESYQEISDFWITNSYVNASFFKKEFNVLKCYIVKNGVDPTRFSEKAVIPTDLKKIKHPRIGFGGKITHQIDTDLFNYLIVNNPDKNFIIIGEMLDRNIYKKIVQRPNLYYLGDKHYDVYPSYISNFDVCILPYVTQERGHGSDPIKLYEYIAARKPVVATYATGAEDLKNWIHIAKNNEEFHKLIQYCLQNPIKDYTEIPHEFTWADKSDQIITYLLRNER